MKKYIPKLVEGTDDQYKIHVKGTGNLLCDDQLDEEFVKLEDVLAALEASEGDLGYFKFKLEKGAGDGK